MALAVVTRRLLNARWPERRWAIDRVEFRRARILRTHQLIARRDTAMTLPRAMGGAMKHPGCV